MVALVEQQIERSQDGVLSGVNVRQVFHVGQPAQLTQTAATPMQASVDGLSVDQERLADLLGGQTTQPPQDQCHVRLAVQAGVANREHHRQLAGALGSRGQCRLDRAGQRRRRRQLGQERAAALFSADDVDRPVVGGPDDPRLRVLRQTEAPGVHGTHQRVVDDILGERDVGRAQDPGQRADQVRVLLPEQVLNQLRRRHRGGPFVHERQIRWSWTGRTSTEPPNSYVGHVRATSMASSREAASMIMLPVTRSFDSA